MYLVKAYRRKMRIALAAALCVLFVAAAGLAALNKFYKVERRGTVSFENMVEDLGDADIIFVGEEHGNERHQKTAIKILDALKGKGKSVALGLEMFTAESQPTLNRWVAGEAPLEEMVDAFQANWNFPWRQYERVFTFAREGGVPLVGLNVPREITRKVASSGFASLSQEDLRALPEGLTCDVDEQYMEFIRRVYRAHGKRGKSFEFFCEAQMVWDSAMAHYITEYLNNNPGRTMVVLAGSKHSWKRGIPEQVRRRADFKYKVVIPEGSGVGAGDVTSGDADYVIPASWF